VQFVAHDRRNPLAAIHFLSNLYFTFYEASDQLHQE